MEAADPPRIVFETPAPCADASHAEEVLRRMLATSRTPTQGWTLAVHVERTGRHALRAEGLMTDGSGALVARRVLSGANACSGLARALAVWTLLVLDARRQDATSASSSPGGTAAPGQRTPASLRNTQPTPDARTGAHAPSTSAGAPAPAPSVVPDDTGGPLPPWPPAAPIESASPEPSAPPRHYEEPTEEFGLGGFLMAGTGPDALAGGTAFAASSVGPDVVLRPALLIGKSTSSAPPHTSQATFFAARFDTCLRVPGLYSNGRGMQFDACGGVDLGVYGVGGSLNGLVGVGPSLDLRGELGGPLAAAIRGVCDINALRATRQDSLVSGRIEFAFSWSLR